LHDGLHGLDFNLEQQFNGGLDFGLVASRSTLNNTWLFFSATEVAFSETIGATRTWAKRPSS